MEELIVHGGLQHLVAIDGQARLEGMCAQGPDQRGQREQQRCQHTEAASLRLHRVQPDLREDLPRAGGLPRGGALPLGGGMCGKPVCWVRKGRRRPSLRSPVPGG